MDTEEMQAALLDSNRRFRLLESAGILRLGSSRYPGLLKWADLADHYHFFMMTQVPGRGFSSPTSVEEASDSDERLLAEKSRLQDVWLNSGPLAPLVCAYWSAANFDGLRAAVWLLECVRSLRSKGDIPEYVSAGLVSIVSSYNPDVDHRVGRCQGAVDLYVALDIIARSMSDLLDVEDALDDVAAFKLSSAPIFEPE